MKNTVEEKIRNAFSGAEIPRGKLCVDTYDYEGAHEHFTGTSWEEHDVVSLREYESSMCFFTPEAFHYYLPAFMLAEIKDPETADVISENIAHHFIDGAYKEERLAQFNEVQLKAVIEFLELCAERYDDGIYDVLFRSAAHEVRKALNDS